MVVFLCFQPSKVAFPNLSHIAFNRNYTYHLDCGLLKKVFEDGVKDFVLGSGELVSVEQCRLRHELLSEYWRSIYSVRCGEKTGSSHHYTRRQAKIACAREVFACRRVLWGVGEYLGMYIYGRFSLLYFTPFRMLLSSFLFSLLNRFLFSSTALPCDSLCPSKEGLQAVAFATCV